MKNKLTVERLKELIHYDPITGIFTWLKDRTGGVKKGCHPGTNTGGYLTFLVDNQPYKSHRLAYLYMTGNFPVEYIDHINGNKSDNRWANLRAATNQQNQFNRGVVSSNTGIKNVTFVKKRNVYQVAIKVSGKNMFFGYYDDLELAELVAISAREKYHGEYVRHV